MLTQSGLDAGLAGNVGLAPLEIADKHKLVVFELSSYQTADMAFSPDIAAVTNLTPEHTDWHRDVEHYFADKLNLIDRDKPFPVGLGPAAQTNPLVLAALRDTRRLLPPLAPFIADRIASTVGKSQAQGRAQSRQCPPRRADRARGGRRPRRHRARHQRVRAAAASARRARASAA